MAMLVCAMLLCVGCSDKKNDKIKGDERFTYDWYMYSLTGDKGTTYSSQGDPYAAKFESSDGESCVFTNNGKPHNGTLTKIEGNRYNLVFDDSKAHVEAEISDDTLTIDFSNGKIVVVFKRAE